MLQVLFLARTIDLVGAKNERHAAAQQQPSDALVIINYCRSSVRNEYHDVCSTHRRFGLLADVHR